MTQVKFPDEEDGLTPSQVVGHNVRAARERIQLSAAAVARTCGWTRQKQSNLERGRQAVTVDELIRLAQALGVAPVWLLADVDGETLLRTELPGHGTISQLHGNELASWLVGDHMGFGVGYFSQEQFYEFAPPYGRRRTRDVIRRLRKAGVLAIAEDGREVLRLGGWTIVGASTQEEE